ncbi:MAG: S24/S26 family peptidase [Tissierellia bacterium]|nr:S24/S26 family peptidase [Tissierellia bacterium]
MLKIVKVRGVSMTPLYNPKEYLLCKRASKIKIGDIVIANTKTYGKIVKMVKEIDYKNRTCWLQGINPNSISSKEIGEIAFKDIEWIVIFPIRNKLKRELGIKRGR